MPKTNNGLFYFAIAALLSICLVVSTRDGRLYFQLMEVIDLRIEMEAVTTK